MRNVSKRKPSLVGKLERNQPFPPQLVEARKIACDALAAVKFSDRQISESKRTGKLPMWKPTRRLFHRHADDLDFWSLPRGKYLRSADAILILRHVNKCERLWKDDRRDEAQKCLVGIAVLTTKLWADINATEPRSVGARKRNEVVRKKRTDFISKAKELAAKPEKPGRITARKLTKKVLYHSTCDALPDSNQHIGYSAFCRHYQ